MKMLFTYGKTFSSFNILTLHKIRKGKKMQQNFAEIILSPDHPEPDPVNKIRFKEVK